MCICDFPLSNYTSLLLQIEFEPDVAVLDEESPEPVRRIPTVEEKRQALQKQHSLEAQLTLLPSMRSKTPTPPI